ncbi:MAG: pyroglutamyl-peptidase I family protein [Candidatus Poseidoniales archaeon]
MARVLVTGFEPFGTHRRNISSEVVRELPSNIRMNDPWADLRQKPAKSLDISIETRVLSVDEAGSTEIASALHQGQNWDAILHIGLCESCRIPRLETLAQDRIDMRIPDNKGRQIMEQPITGQGDLYVTVPAQSWMNRDWSMECELSVDAGSYLCNETLYRTLSALESTSSVDESVIPCLFLHLPSHENCSLASALELVQELLQRMMYRPVLSVVAALISHDDQYLVARRSPTERHAGAWEFPGGKVEPNETLTEALEREIQEEFGWYVACENPVGTWYHSLKDVDIALHVLPTSFHGDAPHFEDKELWTAHDAIALRSLADTTPLDWLGNDEAVVDWMIQTSYLPTTK